MTTHRQLTHNGRRLLLVPVVALVIVGCGSGSSKPAPSPSPSLTGSASPSVANQGSAKTADGRFVQYPDGLRAEVAAVAVGPAPAEEISNHPTWTQRAVVTFKMSNTGRQTVSLSPVRASLSSPITVFFGVNRTQAQCFLTDGGADELPQQLVAGTSATFRQDCTMPAGPQPLTVTFQTGHYTPYTFTDVESLEA